MLGVAANDKDQLHIVRFIVNRPENELASIEVLATEDRAVFELLSASDSRSSIPVSALLEYIGIGEAVVKQEQIQEFKRLTNVIKDDRISMSVMERKKSSRFVEPMPKKQLQRL